ncbi:5-guanidino-2-oxopentanoate decarboxylase [Rhodococcus sp. ABRD24]|uniref:thiamine pyrophosphate-binding protein n=1 Tax=Rhodococcus sp. ABRD24 TaxID=2507582 RepID=UPI00103BE31A|nr:5-guanidino-2-oxopentanoate decarboxylase [Rhodococcus sp. ABRD24]QBJ96296.1 5-guanidino-2-oxopentanoate decarboxylase [Rhodococcus sp. ABRD24]
MTVEKQTGGRALVTALSAHGVEVVFGIPGTHNLPIYAALAESGITHISPRHEQGAGYAADGYARVSGRPGVCITTTGPAILNAAAAAAQAYSDSVPVLFIAPGLPLGHPSNGNGYLHEVKNQFGAMDSIVGHSQRVTSVEEIPLAVAQCFAAMTTGRPRPAYLEVPLDLLDACADVQPVPPVQVPVMVPSPDQVRAAAELIAAASRPLLIAGGGSCSAAGQLRDFAETIGAPVITTANGKGVLSEEHPLSLGAGLHHPTVADLVADADLVIAVGTELAPSDLWIGPLRAEGRLIRIDIDPTSVSTNAVATIALVGDSGATLAALQNSAGSSGGSGVERAADWRKRLRVDAEHEGARYVSLCASLDKSLDEGAILSADSAMACYYGALSNLPLHQPRSFLYPTGLGTLGYGLPAAIGAKVAAPDRQVVAMLGDGGVMFTVAELAAAAEAGLAIPVIIVDNGGYGEIRNEMVDRGEAVHAVELGSLDFPALARSLGCHGVALSSADEVGDAVRWALDADRPTLIHVRESEDE